MRIIEYKLEIKENGDKDHPAWVVHADNHFGLFPNEKTYIGAIPEDEDADYFIPSDRFTLVTLEELIQRSIAEQNKEDSVNRITNAEGEVLDDEGVTSFITEWWNSVV